MSDINIDVTPYVVDVIIANPETIGPVGPPGPPGPHGDGQLIAYNADMVLSGHRVMVATQTGVAYANNTDISHAYRVVGVSENSATIGDAVSIRVFGEMIEPSWSWSTGPIWVGDTGYLTQTPPTSPATFSMVIAEALSPTKIFINPSFPIFI